MKKIFSIVAALMLFSLSGIAQALPSIYPSSGILCIGSSMNLSDTGMGTWSSSNPLIASVGSTGVLTGVSLGVVTVTYTYSGSSVTGTYTVSSTPAPITGGSGVGCIGSTITLTDATPGGSWSSTSTGVATISGTGILTGISAGTTTISYVLSGCYATATYTVDPTVTAITGGTSAICVGSSTTLTDATAGGVWSSGASSVATVGSVTGVVVGVSAGTASITYSTGTPCPAVTTVTVSSTTPYVGAIMGPSVICTGSTATYTDTIGTTGTWSLAGSSVATIGSSTGVVSGLSAGVDTIIFAASGACGTAYAVMVFTVSATTSTGTISGPSTVAAGASINLYETVSGGVWSSGSPSVATVGASSGVVSGVAAGTDVITYTVSGCGGSAYTTTTVSVTSFSGISGYVHFNSGFYGPVRVYLISYDPTTMNLSAQDSVTNTCSGDSVYYQFTGLSTDSFRVKAWVNDTLGVSSGYEPTYHDSSFYWDSASVIYYTSGTAATFEDIYMLVGSSTTGTGFIGGNVTSGANRGTSGGVPVVGLKMYVVNSAGNKVAGMTRTDASGSYSFSNLPFGTYYVFPDSLNFHTIAYTNITLASGSATRTAANFTQHTVSKTITPNNEAVSPVTAPTAFALVTPNPANNMLNISWKTAADETAAVAVHDITGRLVSASSLLLSKGSGSQQQDISSLPNGIYIVTIKSASIDYSEKVQVQH